MKNFDLLLDEFFDSVSPNEVVEMFMAQGYEFELKQPNIIKKFTVKAASHQTVTSQIVYSHLNPVEVETGSVESLVTTNFVDKGKYQNLVTKKIELDDPFDFKGNDSIYKYPMAA